jgi:DNA helicase IV
VLLGIDYYRMQQNFKDKILTAAKAELAQIGVLLRGRAQELQASLHAGKEQIKRLPPSEVPTLRNTLNAIGQKIEQVDALIPSPYFSKCTATLNPQHESRVFYFGKFACPEVNIFSWTSPAARMRFSPPGQISYEVPQVGVQTGTLEQKDQFLIVDSQIRFFSTESRHSPRQLIYQEHFSNRKTTFALPEIVERMEQAQDEVIRAHPYGPLLIQGPAGSGKTTLALHRVAYLLQSPETAEFFKPEDVLVLVQDAATKEYFSTLLPDLGIHNVELTTFDMWVKSKLSLHRWQTTNHADLSEPDRDILLFEKLSALQRLRHLPWNDNVEALLVQCYDKRLSARSSDILQLQYAFKELDHVDLTVLLWSYLATYKGFFTYETEYTQLKAGKVKRTKKAIPQNYKLLVIDEVENFLPQQLTGLHRVVHSPHGSAIYIGDLAQQTKLGTIRDWTQAGIELPADRKITLYKNYRSTKQIMECIRSFGFEVEIPVGLRDGKAAEFSEAVGDQALAAIQRIIAANPQVATGVIGKDAAVIAEYKVKLAQYNNVHILSIEQAQGVEFDIVCLVGLDKFFNMNFGAYPVELQKARQDIDKDLLYVGLTRAMNELYIFGISKPITILVK